MLGLLFDIHGNLPALTAVLDDARRAGAERYLLGGDYTLFGAWPAETLERLDALDAEWLRGNGERWTADPSDAPDREPLRSAMLECRRRLDEQRMIELSRLPLALERDGTLFCHASPRSDVHTFMPEPGDDEPELLAGVRRRRLVFGHSHLQFRRRDPSGIELINPGSIGLPYDGDPRAGYALMDSDGEIELRRVAYDVSQSAEAVRERFGPGPWAETVARRIELARLVPLAGLNR